MISTSHRCRPPLLFLWKSQQETLNHSWLAPASSLKSLLPSSSQHRRCALIQLHYASITKKTEAQRPSVEASSHDVWFLLLNFFIFFFTRGIPKFPVGASFRWANSEEAHPLNPTKFSSYMIGRSFHTGLRMKHSLKGSLMALMKAKSIPHSYNANTMHSDTIYMIHELLWKQGMPKALGEWQSSVERNYHRPESFCVFQHAQEISWNIK